MKVKVKGICIRMVSSTNPSRDSPFHLLQQSRSSLYSQASEFSLDDDEVRVGNRTSGSRFGSMGDEASFDVMSWILILTPI